MGFDFDSKIDWNSRTKVKGNLGMGDKKSNAKGVSPHLFLTNVCHSVCCKFEVVNGKVEIGE